jgi:hypothetical protein
MQGASNEMASKNPIFLDDISVPCERAKSSFRHQGIRIEPDATYPSMFRVKLPSGVMSDMLNMARAKDCAHVIAELKAGQRIADAVRLRAA